MSDQAEDSFRTANDNLYRLKPSAEATKQSFNPAHFERLIEQKLNEYKRPDESTSDQLICHVY
jgi:hypothetical protein